MEQQITDTFSLSTISNEETAALSALAFEGDIVVVDREEMVEAACCDLAACPIIGFDTETRPSFKAGVTYKVSLLQLSTPTRCYLFRLNKVAFSDPIIAILESDKILKLGADIAGDIRSLNQLRPIQDRGFYDLQSYIWEWGIGEKSLRKISALVLGKKVSKAQRLSNWEAAQFTHQQRVYAATDAWVSIEIYNKLQTMPKLTKEQMAQIRAEQAARAAAAAERKAAKLAAAIKEGRVHPRHHNRRRRAKEATDKTNKTDRTDKVRDRLYIIPSSRD